MTKRKTKKEKKGRKNLFVDHQAKTPNFFFKQHKEKVLMVIITTNLL